MIRTILNFVIHVRLPLIRPYNVTISLAQLSYVQQMKIGPDDENTTG
jgi:hypothetical protein